VLSSLLRLADFAAVSAAAGMRLYEGGFGDRAELEGLVRVIEDRTIADEDVRVRVELGAEVAIAAGSTRRAGRFVSPSAGRLPPESKVGLLELSAPPGGRGKIVILLAATGEEGFWFRRRFSEPLNARGIATLSLENAFYGARRPRGQRASLVRTVRDQFAMNVATVQEARALALWVHENGYSEVCLTGFSQGGLMASFAASLTPFAVAVCARGAGDAASPIFTNAALSRRIDWQRLGSELGGEAAARRYFQACLEPVRVSRFPVPRAAGAAVLLGLRGDGFIPASEVLALHRHWGGSELRWLTTSHVIAALLHSASHQQAICDSLERISTRAAT
jgi:hypothetical protein